MGTAIERFEELDRQIQKLIAERESARVEAQKEKLSDLEQVLSDVTNSIQTLDDECTEIEKKLKIKSGEFNKKRKEKDEVAFQVEELKKDIGLIQKE